MASYEKRLENNFVEWCKKRDIIAIKGPAQTAKGFPDRFLQLPHGGGSIYVEFKGDSYYGLSKIQKWWKKYIKDSSPHRYFIVDDMKSLDRLKRACEFFMKHGEAMTNMELEYIKNNLPPQE